MTRPARTRSGIAFPLKLDDSYPCAGVDDAGVRWTFDDLLFEGGLVASYVDRDGNTYGPGGVVVRREDGLWAVRDD